MRRARASAPALAAIGLLVALLASILAAGPASAADRPGGGAPTPPPCTQRAGQVPPPVCRVTVQLNDGPRTVTGSVSATNAVEYVIKGRAGAEFSLELLDLNNGNCNRLPSLDLQVTTATGELIEATGPKLRGCTSYGPWTLPADGTVLIRTQGDSATASTYKFRFGRIQIEEVRARLRSGQVRLTGTLDVALDGIQYAFTATPGQQISLNLDDPLCSSNYFFLLFTLLDSSGQAFGGASFPCQPWGTWTVPADGIFKLQVKHWSGLLNVEQRGRYGLTVNVFDYPDVAVAAGNENVPISGTVGVPMSGTDYVIATPPGVRLVTLDVLAPVAGATCDDSTDLALNVAVVVDGVAGPSQPLHCGLNGPWDPAGAASLTLRVTGLSQPYGARPSVGPYRLVLHPVTTAQIAVDVRNGPVVLSGALNLDFDVDEYVITGTPGSLVGIYDPAASSPEGFCNTPVFVEPVDPPPFDPSAPPSFKCGRFGPWRLPDSGTMTVRVSTWGVFTFGPAGPYRLGFAPITYETVPVDVSAGPVTVSGQIDVPLDGTDYVFTGQPGDIVELTIDGPPESCAETGVVPLQLAFFDGSWNFFGTQDVGLFGCQGNSFVLGDDGVIVVRVYLDGTGPATSGGYAITFSRFVPPPIEELPV